MEGAIRDNGVHLAAVRKSFGAVDVIRGVDIAAVLAPDGASLTVFAVNRSPDEAMELDLALGGFGNARLIEHQVIGGDGTGPRVANTAQEPDRIRPRKGTGMGVADGGLRGELPAFSYHLLRLALN